MDGCEVVVVALVVSGCDGTKMLEFVEEPLDEVALSIETLVKARWLEPIASRSPIHAPMFVRAGPGNLHKAISGVSA